MSKKNKAKQMVSVGIEAILGIAVLAFMGFHTINFFTFIFPEEKFYLAVLGFALTSGAAIGYLIIFKFKSESGYQKTIAAVMMGASIIGEIVTAGYGMQVEAWIKSGIKMTQSDLEMMVLFVQVLALVHFVALVLYYTLDELIELFGDEDGDGVINAIDKDYRKKKVYASEGNKEELAPKE